MTSDFFLTQVKHIMNLYGKFRSEAETDLKDARTRLEA